MGPKFSFYRQSKTITRKSFLCDFSDGGLNKVCEQVRKSFPGGHVLFLPSPPPQYPRPATYCFISYLPPPMKLAQIKAPLWCNNIAITKSEKTLSSTGVMFIFCFTLLLEVYMYKQNRMHIILSLSFPSNFFCLWNTVGKPSPTYLTIIVICQFPTIVIIIERIHKHTHVCV